MPELTILILNYNTAEKLRDCLNSLLALRHEADFEILVVDNASTDKSAAMVKDNFPELRLIESPQNLWFSGGNNLGIHAATGEFVWILNPDTLVQENCIRNMLNYLKNNESLGAVTSKQKHPDGEVLPICSQERGYWDLLLDDTLLGVIFGRWRKTRRAELWYKDWERDSLREVEIAPASSLMVKADILQKIGGFDEQLRLYFTDDDLCHDIRAEGKTIHFLPDALILHYEKSSVTNRGKFYRETYYADMLAYSRKHFGTIATSFLAFWVKISQWAMNLKETIS